MRKSESLRKRLWIVLALIPASSVFLVMNKTASQETPQNSPRQFRIVVKSFAQNFKVADMENQGRYVRLTLRNDYDKTVTAFGINSGGSNIRVDLVGTDQVIKPGNTHVQELSLPPARRNNQSATSEMVLSITAVVFEDETGDGSSEVINEVLDARAGRLEDPTTLKARIKPFKAKGAKKVVFPGPLVYYDQASSLDEALSRYSVVIAQPVDKISLMMTPDSITTYYKLKIVKNISQVKHSGCCAPDSLPKELPPLEADEIYLRVGGGTVMLDGVEVTVEGALSGLSMSEQYLLFLAQNFSIKAASTRYGPNGVFRVMSGNLLESITDKPNSLKSGMSNLYIDSVYGLEKYLELRLKKPKQ